MQKRSVKRTSGKKKLNSKKNGTRVFLRVLMLIILLTVLGFGVYSYYCLYNMNKAQKNGNKENVEAIEAANNDPINILVAGVDVGTAGSTNPNDPKRTDTMMLLHYSPQEKRADVISIPRDTKVQIDGKIQKINAANAIGGISYAIDSVENLLDIEVNYYVKINYEGFRKIIDAIDGIDMPITHNMDYDDPGQNLHIHFAKGTTVHLDGQKAEEFFRWRKNNNGTGLARGDLDRIDNQHMFIQKVIEKVKSPTIIFKIEKILSILSENVETNMSPTDIIKYGLKFSTMNKQNIKMATLKGEGKYIDGISYFVYEPSKNDEIIQSIHDIKAMSISRSQIKINILNCTDKVGLAANYRDYLKTKGYTNIQTGNGEKLDSTVVNINSKFDDDVIANIKNEFNINNVQQNEIENAEYDIEVKLGEDWDYIK